MRKSPLLYHDGTIWRYWETYREPHDRVAIFVGGGPSLNNINVSNLTGPGKTVFGVNTTYPKVRPDIWVGMDDPKCYHSDVFYEPFPKIMRGNYHDRELHGKSIKEFPNTYFASLKEGNRKSDLFGRIGSDSDCFLWDKNVFVTTINLILHMGYRKIYLAGVDFDNSTEDYHHGLDLPKKYKNWNQNLYNNLYHYLNWLHKTGSMGDIEILSISPKSKINNIVPYVSLEDLNKSLNIPKPDKLYHCGEIDKQNQVLNILTTATPRSDLHLKGLFQAISSIHMNGDKIKWFVNLDCPSYFSSKDVKNSTEKFKQLEALLPNLTLKLNVSLEGNFSKASEYLFNKCNSLLDRKKDNVFMWLEDDWNLVKPQDFALELEKYFGSKAPFITAGACEYVCGNPLVFRTNFFDKVLDLYKKEVLIDPELTFFKAAKELYATEKERSPIKDSIHLKHYFIDVGRNWREERNIIKQDKYKNTLHTWRKD